MATSKQQDDADKRDFLDSVSVTEPQNGERDALIEEFFKYKPAPAVDPKAPQ